LPLQWSKQSRPHTNCGRDACDNGREYRAVHAPWICFDLFVSLRIQTRRADHAFEKLVHRDVPPFFNNDAAAIRTPKRRRSLVMPLLP
jgi:hypothetical protein